MTLTKEEKAMLKALVKKELEAVKEEGQKILIVNSPFLSGITRTHAKDIPFLASEKLYQEFMEKLLEKL
jgi:collagenase-like PrtC family protease